MTAPSREVLEEVVRAIFMDDDPYIAVNDAWGSVTIDGSSSRLSDEALAYVRELLAEREQTRFRLDRSAE